MIPEKLVAAARSSLAAALGAPKAMASAVRALRLTGRVRTRLMPSLNATIVPKHAGCHARTCTLQRARSGLDPNRLRARAEPRDGAAARAEPTRGPRAGASPPGCAGRWGASPIPRRAAAGAERHTEATGSGDDAGAGVSPGASPSMSYGREPARESRNAPTPIVDNP